MNQHEVFVFERYSFDPVLGQATFEYSFDGTRQFKEVVTFDTTGMVDHSAPAFEAAMQLAFLLAGVSYYKTFPTRSVSFKDLQLTSGQADFLNHVYLEGLSQFIYENKLGLDAIVRFEASSMQQPEPRVAGGEGMVCLQSGGKDSLLLASLLDEASASFTPWYVASGMFHPSVLDSLSGPLRTIHRQLDSEALATATRDGGYNGHIPVTFVLTSYAILDALLHGENTVLQAIGHEGAEPHAYVGDLAVNHQWSKTWEAEQLMQRYVSEYIAADIRVGSPLRSMTELKIAELFAAHAWQKYGHSFSSCNVANYGQQHDNTVLTWCGNCPKCANSYLLFAPFVAPDELRSLFGGSDLFAKESLTDDFKGLLGIDNVMKPFECVGEIDELRTAYHMARSRYGEETYRLPFDVPYADFDYNRHMPSQSWASALIDHVY